MRLQVQANVSAFFVTPTPISPPAADVARRLSRAPVRGLAAAVLVAAAASACYKVETGPSSTLLYRSNPCASPDTVSVVAARTQVIDCSNGGTTVNFVGSGASYLIVPEFATDNAPFAFVEYAVASGTESPTAPNIRAAVRANPGLAAAVEQARLGTAQRKADGLLRARGSRLAAAGAFRASHALALRGAERAAIQRGPVPPLGSVRSFKVASNIFASTNSWATVRAQLEYVGANILLYQDSLAPDGGFTAAQLQTYGQYFDQTLFPIDTTAFGSPTDIDGNGHVVVLMSNVVNADTPASTCSSAGFVAGFFNPEDFTPTAVDTNSNQGEIFYTIVADPDGTLSCAHAPADVQFAVPATFLHELQHLINFGQHVVVAGGEPGASWLDEGLSTVAEELGSLYYEQKCPPPSCRTDPAQLFPDSSQPFVQNFLSDSYEYALVPDTASILLENDGDPGTAWRGGAWLLVRWLADQKGTGVYRQLEQGSPSGATAISQVMGEPFPQAFADFGLALYTDSLPGLPRATAPAANRFTTRNLRQMWARLYTTSGAPLVMPVQPFPVSSDTTVEIVFPGTVTYFRLDTPSNAATVSVRFAGPGGAAFQSSLQPQLAIFRLPPGQ